MKKFLRGIALTAAAVTMLASAAACSSNPASEYDLVTQGTLIMGTNAEFPPFEYKEGDAVGGVDAALMEKVAEKLDLKLEIKDMAFESLPEALSGKNIDVIAAGFTIDPDREEKMDFTDSYYTAKQTVLLRADSPYTSIEEMKGRGLKIGAQTGTTGMTTAAPELTEEANIIGYNNGSLAVEALLNGNVDAVIIDNNPANEYKDQHGDAIKLLEDQFDEEHYCIAVRKGSSALQEAINKALQELKDEGELQKIIDEYVK